jgi:hypothetical protein
LVTEREGKKKWKKNGKKKRRCERVDRKPRRKEKTMKIHDLQMKKLHTHTPVTHIHPTHQHRSAALPSTLYVTMVSTRCTFVEKDRSLTFSACSIMRASESSLLCFVGGSGWGGETGRVG